VRTPTRSTDEVQLATSSSAVAMIELFKIDVNFIILIRFIGYFLLCSTNIAIISKDAKSLISNYMYYLVFWWYFCGYLPFIDLAILNCQ
jgi:hypothetical protein